MATHGISGVPVIDDRETVVEVIGSQKIHDLGYFYALIPGGVGPVIMLVVALLVNNIPKNRRYPEFWL